ncbi:DUF4340 domain-containing protein [Chloroflexota bacterium]
MRLRNIFILLAILLALGGYYYFSNIPEPPAIPEPILYVWNTDVDTIEHIEIRLLHEDKGQAFIKIPEEGKYPWYFDDQERSEVSTTRWGGIPMLLSRPGADRPIAQNVTPEKLAVFGLSQPQMEINLGLEDGNIINIKVGNSAPDGHAFYVQLPNTKDVALIDNTWYEVVERLVTEPPYVIPEEE